MYTGPVHRAIYPTTFFIRFAILEDDEPQNTFVVGDFMIRQQVIEFCGRVLRRRCNYLYPGAGIDDIPAALDELTPDATNDSLCLAYQ